MILLIGLVTKNSILLVEYINQLKERGMTTRGRGAGGRPHPAPAHPDDLGGDRHGCPADRAGPRRRLAEPPAARATPSWAACCSPRCSPCTWCRRCT